VSLTSNEGFKLPANTGDMPCRACCHKRCMHALHASAQTGSLTACAVTKPFMPLCCYSMCMAISLVT
jgi:hypothetical protein